MHHWRVVTWVQIHDSLLFHVIEEDCILRLYEKTALFVVFLDFLTISQAAETSLIWQALTFSLKSKLNKFNLSWEWKLAIFVEHDFF